MHHSFQVNGIIRDKPMVFLPGWGFDGRIIALARPTLPCYYPTAPLDPETVTADLLTLLDKKKIDRVELVGWSMGALLALDFAGRYPDRIAALFLISLRRKWPVREIRRLSREFAAAPTEFMTVFYRKCFIGHSEAYKKFTATLQPDYLRTMSRSSSNLPARGLAYMAAAACRPAVGVKTHLIHGRRDIIAPLDRMPELPGADCEIIDHAGHLPFLEPACSLIRRQKKRAVRQKFSRAAATYDQYAVVQKKLGRHLIEAAEISAEQILEIGCGTGNFTALLARRYPRAAITALDFSREMLDTAHLKLRSFPEIKLTCADGETFLAEGAPAGYDLIASNGALQWFMDPRRAFADMARLLRPNGHLLCAVFGPASLRELGEAIAHVFGTADSLPSTAFTTRPALERCLAGLFPTTRIDELLIPHRYASLRDLLVHIKKSGTTGWQAAGPLIFTRSRLARLDKWFIDNHGGCLVTYQVFIVRAGGSIAEN